MKNSTGRKLLEQRYGEGCFMERAGIRKITPEEEIKLKKIKGYKKLDRTISYHHIKERSKGGEVSIENGANLAVYNHQWLHQQEPEVIADINRRLQEFKFSIDVSFMSVGQTGVAVNNFQTIYPDYSDCIRIPVYDNNEIDKKKKKEKFNRARVKRETEKLIDEELYR